MKDKRRSILERLDAGEVIVCDGGYIFALELRGYVTVPHYTPEVVLEHPDAVRQVHKEFALCGSDVLEAMVFNGTDESLNVHRKGKERINSDELNHAACKIVREVADEYGCLVAGPISPTQAYHDKKGKEAVQREVQTQLDVFKKQDIDFLLTEFVGYIEEAEWIIEMMKTANLPVAATLCIGEMGDFSGVPFDECALRLAKTGADLIGINCRFEPDTCVDAVVRMKKVVENAGYKRHYMVQPAGYRSADTGVKGFGNAPETPLALESRLISRFDAHKYARKAYDAGIRFIGGCCGFQAYHIRAVAEELREERGKLPINSRGLWGEHLTTHRDSEHHHKNKDFWYNLVPVDGRDPNPEKLKKSEVVNGN